MATKRKSLKITSIMSKLNALKTAFGEDSKVVEFAEDAVKRNMGAVPDEYKHKDGSVNVNKLVKGYNDKEKTVKQLEADIAKLEGDPTASGIRGILKQRLKVEKQDLRQLKGNVYVTGEEVTKSLQTPNQIFAQEMKALKDKNKAGEPLSPLEMDIVKAKTQKEVREDPRMSDYLRQRANYTAQLANEFNRLEDSLYEMARTDPDVPDNLKEQAWDLYNERSFNPNWLDKANELVGSWYGGMIERDWASLTR